MTNVEKKTALLRLLSMKKESFADFKARSIQEYARSQFSYRLWPSAQEARRQAKLSWRSTLSKGMNSDGHYFYDLECLESKICVGCCWLKVDPVQKAAVLYYIEIFEQYRQQGYAKACIFQLDAMAQKLGFEKILLNVFDNNRPAYELYKKLGFIQVSMNMMKPC